MAAGDCRTPTVVMLGSTAIYAVCICRDQSRPALRAAAAVRRLRTLLGGLGLLSLTIVLRRPFLRSRDDWLGVVTVALSATTVSFGAMFLSCGLAGAGIASVLGNAQPPIVVVLAAIFLGERVTLGKSIALALGLIGVGLIAAPALASSDVYGLAGAALALGASGGLAVGRVIVKLMGPQLDVLALTTWQLILSGLPLLGLSALIESDTGVRWTFQFVGLLLVLALVGTSLASAVWYRLVQRGDVGLLSLFFLLIPVIGVGLAAVLFGERVTPIEGAGVLLTLAGIGVLACESHGSSQASEAVPVAERGSDVAAP